MRGSLADADLPAPRGATASHATGVAAACAVPPPRYATAVRPLLVTRAEDDARALAARLGPHCVVAPCLAWADADDPRPDLPDADVLLTSVRAVDAVVRRGLPPAWRVLALAPATAAAARAAGLTVAVERGGGAAEVARAARPDVPAVAATSDLGGAEVRKIRPDAYVWVVYRTVRPSTLPPEAIAAMEGPFDVLFTSPSAVHNFVVLAPGALERAVRVLCHGRTTIEAVEALGRVADRADLPS